MLVDTRSGTDQSVKAAALAERIGVDYVGVD